MTVSLEYSPAQGGSVQPSANKPQVEVDFGNMPGFMGRIKAPPICIDATLKAESMSPETLLKLCFPLETPPSVTQLLPEISSGPLPHEPSVVSSSSSTASRESAYLSDLDANSSKVTLTPVRLERKQSNAINSKVTAQKISRNGRQTQRWFTCPTTQRVYRMVTGCVPIVEGGKILMVSASRKPEWIIPKGGWEQDEAMEESAIRECFEEAGVLGILGPRLTEIDYETRKSKKRRLESEDVQKKSNTMRDSLVPCSATCLDKAAESTKESQIPRIRMPVDDNCSVASDASGSYSHVRLSLFPLYVSDVKSIWPECGRFRKAVDIDEAIRICEARPEFQTALKELKAKNLHLLSPSELAAPTAGPVGIER